MDWKTFITKAILDGGIFDKPGRFGPPATHQELKALEEFFKGRVPGDLLELLSQANGTFEPCGGYFIMDTAFILQANKGCRTNKSCLKSRKPFEDLLFFGEPGTGDYFGYDLSKPERPIIRWMAIGDDRDWKAKDLRDLIEGWYAGRISA